MVSPGRRGVEVDDVRKESLWASEVSMPRSPQLGGDREVDLAIVGGGCTGLSCSYYVKQFGRTGPWS